MTTPETPAPSSLREAYARIIDPAAWANLGWRKRAGYDTSRDTQRSLAKADAILALSAAPTPLVGGGGNQGLSASSIESAASPKEVHPASSEPSRSGEAP